MGWFTMLEDTSSYRSRRKLGARSVSEIDYRDDGIALSRFACVAATSEQPAALGRRGRHRRLEFDRDKLRDAFRIIGDEHVFYILDDAIDLLPPDKLAKLVGQYIELHGHPRVHRRVPASAQSLHRPREQGCGGRTREAFDTTSPCSRTSTKATTTSPSSRTRRLVAGRRRLGEGVPRSVSLPLQECGASEFARAVVTTVDGFEEYRGTPTSLRRGGLATAERRKALDARVAATPARRR